MPLLLHVDYVPQDLHMECEHGRLFPKNKGWKGTCRAPGYAWVVLDGRMFYVCSEHLVSWYEECTLEDVESVRSYVQMNII